MYGLGAFYRLHWIVPYVGLGLIGVAFHIMIPGCMTYAFDSYPDCFTESVQQGNLLRNTLGGGLTFAIRPWINASGVRNACIGIAMLFFAVNATYLAMAIWGKKMRKASMPWHTRVVIRRDEVA